MLNLMFKLCHHSLIQIGVTHYFSYLKAREELGYIPMVSPRDGLSATISYWQERKRRELDGPTTFTRFLESFGMFGLSVQPTSHLLVQ